MDVTENNSLLKFRTAKTVIIADIYGEIWQF